MTDILGKLVRKIKKRHIQNDDIKLCKIPKGVTLKDEFVYWKIGNNTNIIKLSSLKNHPIVYKEEDIDDEKVTTTLVFNPITMSVILYKHKVDVLDIDKKTKEYLLSIVNFSYMTGMMYATMTGKDIMQLDMVECKVSTLRKIFTIDPDPTYVHITKDGESLLDIKYYKSDKDILSKKIDIISSSLHPKSLIYVIKYKSESTKNDDSYKTTLLISKSDNKDDLEKYLNVQNENLTKRDAFVFNIFLYIGLQMFPESKTVYV